MNQRRGRPAFIVGFLAPAVLMYALFVIYPLAQAFVFSLFQWRGVSSRRKFIGAQNFVDLFHDPIFFKTLRNNLTLLVVGGLAILVLAVAVAHALQSERPAIKFLRGVVLFPQMVSIVAVAVLWRFIFNPEFGLLTSGMKALHLDTFVHTWLGDPKTALPCVGISFVWYSLGFTVMLFSAGLRSIPAEVQEASALDGAIGFRRFWLITWPMLWAVKRVAIVNLTIAVMNTFALVYLMTQGEPDRATEVMLTYLYENAFTNSKFGYATAIAVVNFIVVMVLSVLILFIMRRDPQEPLPAKGAR